MSVLGAVRLLPLLRCQHAAALCAGRSRTLSSFQWPLAKHCSAVMPLQTWKTAQHDVFRSPLCIQSLSRLSTANSHSQSSDRAYPRTTKYKNVERSKAVGKPKKSEYGNEFELNWSDPNVSLMGKIREVWKKFSGALKKYWYVVIPVHLATSSIYFLGFCYLASKGFSPIPLLEKLGLFTELLKDAKESKYAIIAVALLFLKLSGPLRLLTTLYIVRALARRNKLLTSSEVNQKVKKYLKGKFPGK